ncbi:precorrin-3B C(17)-methyltransferase [Gloeocapsopsis dulcis]|uniref:Precorrin-3B C(17)-methyltransferase n=1 Tax=Gloeocapsopsis dulcis AAB1 = 1H9 TaxID=1433147 RepID=A0A6N8FWS7_9CHRO|nr:precorrin-3B C(17)-methyltransferase [Gloeocapsopsis dulcis]MUL37319.1 precorrin-3B C(17)-methyltransferase [Gloeocapsopsis dulcis AAB1 = 1H9]WNN91926.1 precorrin-3B C(17)-methyltransferase [Gloeocapsopsis dulcis]
MLTLQNFQPLAAIATTPTAAKTLQQLCQNGITLWVPESIEGIAGAKVYTGSLKSHVAEHWKTHQGLIFGLATGAVVRLIAPLLQHKSCDPAIVVVDETGKFVISLCSGHQGGADKLTQAIAQLLNATPVLTGAASTLGLPAVDILGIPFGWQRGEGNWTEVSAAIARSEPVQVIQEAGSTLWQSTVSFQKSSLSLEASLDTIPRIYITPLSEKGKALHPLPLTPHPSIHWHPRVLWLGIGCERGTSRELIESTIKHVCQDHQLAEQAIAGIATIDIKADEVGLVEMCRDRNFPLCTFPADILCSVTVPNPSKIVDAEVGTPSVAEAAALCAAKAQHLLVSKQIFRASTEFQGAVTVAIAQAEQEYTGRTGCLLLVGIGPGQLDQITPAAQAAVASADAVIGYSLYIDLIAPLLQPHQIIEALPITQERQRAQRAIALAQWGLTVAVVSSGDIGIYGMAGLVLEELQTQGWDGNTPKVEVFPGITAMQAAAARLGAPLMHDFCAISLSDLLTPWEVIEKRLHAAAMADFVTALYNPRSQTRIQQLTTAIEIFLQYRNPQTPVAVVRSVYRQDEQITLTTLEKLLDIPIDMLSTVLIGNQSTRTHGNWMITPRGYNTG